MATVNFVTGTFTNTRQEFSAPGSSTLTVQAEAYIITDSSVDPPNGYAGIDIGNPDPVAVSAWTVNILGSVIVPDDYSGDDLFSNAIQIENFAATANNKLIIGVDGTAYGEDAGVSMKAATDITNSGMIAGVRNAINFNGQLDNGGIGSNMGTPTALKALLIDNKLGAEILSDPLSRNANVDLNDRYAIGIDNWSYATLTVKNAGTIVGGEDVYRDEDDDGEDDDGWSGAAISSHSTLIVANAATGVIDGSIGYTWYNNKIDNLGTINGTIAGYTHNQGGVVDTDRDGLFDDVGGFADVHTLVGTTLTNKGTIVGTSEYGHNYDDWNGSSFDTVNYFQVALDMGSARDTVTNSGKIFGDVWLGEANDIFTNTGTVQGYVDGWDGNDSITNSGTIAYGVGGGTGNDILKNSGAILERVDTGDNNDTITNSGTIGNQDYVDAEDVVLDTGDGNDIVTNTGTILGWVRLQDGNDTYTGSAKVDYVGEDAGADSYNLGAGDDVLWMNESDDNTTDTINGGAGKDWLAMQDLDGPINLDLTLATLQLDLGGNNDTVLAFEAFLGTDFADTFKGTTGAQEFYGGDGADDLAGGAGRDILEGGADADIFRFNALTDSTVARANRDMILDFVQGEDTIDLSALDANSLVVGNDAFTLIGGNTSFSAAGQLRYRFDGLNTIVEGNVNGDSRADFAIAVVGHINFTGSDFVV